MELGLKVDSNISLSCHKLLSISIARTFMLYEILNYALKYIYDGLKFNN